MAKKCLGALSLTVYCLILERFTEVEVMRPDFSLCASYKVFFSRCGSTQWPAVCYRGRWRVQQSGLCGVLQPQDRYLDHVTKRHDDRTQLRRCLCHWQAAVNTQTKSLYCTVRKPLQGCPDRLVSLSLRAVEVTLSNRELLVFWFPRNCHQLLSV